MVILKRHKVIRHFLLLVSYTVYTQRRTGFKATHLVRGTEGVSKCSEHSGNILGSN
jgi:hypothetical protein